MIDSAVRQYNMLQKGDRVLLALSGGADSVALFHLLCSRREIYGISLEAAHVNHRLRGDESARDRDFVKELCEKSGISLHLLEADIAETARETGESDEECGRRVRYEFFSSVPADKIATAHTKNDLAETVILNLTRGAGLRGLAGIPPVRGNIIRPLINCSRQDVERYCAENKLSFVIDSTNSAEIYRRNFVRHSILPLLSEINPQSTDKIAETALLLRRDADFLDSLARERLESARAPGGQFDISALLHSPAPLLHRALVLMAEDSGITLYAKNIGEMIRTLGESTSCTLPGGNIFVCSCGFCSINPKIPEIPGEIPVEIPSEHDIYNGKIIISPVSPYKFDKDKKINNLLFKNTLDCDMIKRNLVLRSIRPGDRLSLPERGLSKPLRKLFSESGIPLHLRHGVPVIADGDGPLWVQDFGSDARGRANSDSKNIIKIEFVRRISDEG